MGLKPILRNTTSFSGLTLLVGSFDPQNRPEMTYTVFSGTLNPTHFTSLMTHSDRLQRSMSYLLEIAAIGDRWCVYVSGQ